MDREEFQNRGITLEPSSLESQMMPCV